MAGRDVRPINNKNIGGADVYFANQFLQQQNLGKSLEYIKYYKSNDEKDCRSSKNYLRRYSYLPCWKKCF